MSYQSDKQISEWQKFVGSFICGTTMMISDPCYNSAEGDLIVKPGTYNAYITLSDEGDWGERVAALSVLHVSLNQTVFRNWVASDEGTGVDSGQAGFFSEEIYPRLSEDLYDEVCNLTLGASQSGIIQDQGAVSSSGFGDGGYPCYVYRKKKEIVAATLEYIDPTIKKLRERGRILRTSDNDLPLLVNKVKFQENKELFAKRLKQ